MRLRSLILGCSTALVLASLGLTSLGLVSSGCVDPGAYSCMPLAPDGGAITRTDSGMAVVNPCTRPDKSGGICRLALEDNSAYCAFPDPTCAEFQLRWDESAGAGLGKNCVTRPDMAGSMDMGMPDLTRLPDLVGPPDLLAPTPPTDMPVLPDMH